MFAYREVSQESTGFSPFQLLYRRTIRGSMEVLKDLWTENYQENEVKNTYEYVVDLRNKLHGNKKVVHDILSKSQLRQKYYYNKKVKGKKLKEGDEVLILLPTVKNKIKMQWKAPYRVIGQRYDNDYLMKIKGKERLYHMSLLKRYVEPEDISCSVFVIEYEESYAEDEAVEDTIITNDPAPDKNINAVKMCEKVNNTLRNQLKERLGQYKNHFSSNPGCIKGIDHKIYLTSEQSFYSKPYPLPHSV